MTGKIKQISQEKKALHNNERFAAGDRKLSLNDF